MKNSFFKMSLLILLVISLLSLTACGGGGGGGGNSSDNGNGNGGSNSIINNQTLQTTAVSNVLANIINNLNNLFRTSSIRTSAFPDELYESVGGWTGYTLLKIAKVKMDYDPEKGGEFNFEVNDLLDSSLKSFKNRFQANEIIKEDSNMIIAKSDGYNIGFTIQQNGDVKMSTYFITYGTKSGDDPLIGVSFIKCKDYVTFPFRRENSGTISGYVFTGFQLFNGYANSGSPEETLAHIFATDDKEFSYENYKTHESSTIQISKTASGGNDQPLADEGRFGEVKGVRFALKPLVENIDRLINLTTTSSARADIIIPDSLSKYNTGKELKKIIPSTTIDEFMSNGNITNKTKVLDKKPIANDKDIPDGKGTISMAVGRHTNGLNVGISVAEAKITVENQTINYKVTVRFVAEPNGDAVVAIGTLDGGASNFISAILFRTNKDASEIVGKTFGKNMHDTLESCDNYSFDGDGNKTSDITGNTSQFCYTHTDGGTRVTQYDGTVVSTNN